MISVADVVADPDMIAPQPFTIFRSVDTFVLGGVQSTTTPTQAFGPVQQASNKEIQMLPEADRVEGIRSFWWLQPIYVTRGTVSVPATYGEVPTGSDTTYTTVGVPPDDTAILYANGLMLIPGIDYVLNGNQIEFTNAPSDPIYITWPTTALVGNAASDILQYGVEQYRVISVYRDPGGGYWKALARRMDAA